MSTKPVPPAFPIEKEPKIPTLDKPLIIESAFPGWLPLSVNPHIPYKTEEVAREIIDSVREGAGAVHVHPRNPEDGSMMMDPHVLKATLDLVFEECPDVFTWNHSWVGKPQEPISYIEHTQVCLELGNGPRYVEGSVVLLRGNPIDRVLPRSGDLEAIKEGVQWLEANGVKPIFQIYDTNGIETLVRHIIEPGLAKWEPFMCVLQMGKHDAMYVAHDPWAHLQLITSMNMLKAAVPGCIVGLRAGGRNWLPLTAAAIAMGIDMVGVGMEDCLWMYPHKDEIMKKNSEVIRKVAAIARELGRDIATPADIRRILNTEHVRAVERFQEAA